MPRATIRFPEDLHSAISAEAERRGKPWTFSSVLVEWAERGGACQDLTFCLAKPAKDSQTYARSLVRAGTTGA